jgi:hypothetical protein
LESQSSLLSGHLCRQKGTQLFSHPTAGAQADGNFSSPRWLISKGRNGEARAVLIKYHTGGDANAALLLFEMAEIEKTIALEREAKNSTSYMDMFRTKGNRHRLLITVTLGVFGQWVGKYVFRILL